MPLEEGRSICELLGLLSILSGNAMFHEAMGLYPILEDTKSIMHYNKRSLEQ